MDFFFFFLYGDLERTFILIRDESGCNPPKSELLIEQPNVYILYVDDKGEGGPSGASVSGASCLVFLTQEMEDVDSSCSHPRMDRRIEPCPFYSLASSECFSLRPCRETQIPLQAAGSRRTDVKIQLYASFTLEPSVNAFTDKLPPHRLGT